MEDGLNHDFANGVILCDKETIIVQKNPKVRLDFQKLIIYTISLVKMWNVL